MTRNKCIMYGPDADISLEEGYVFIGFEQCECNRCIVATFTVLTTREKR